MSITTKKGDAGQTDLFDGTRVSKANERITCIASIDELNSHIGLARSLGGDEFLETIQNAFIASRKQKNEKVLYLDKASDSFDILKFILQIMWEMEKIDNKK